eukprot:c4430_g1_i1.p1 GENE.c4430_g1_i1~~c4430_g1_i1.p1  ORF type:complete len:450 (+),score=102.11 c4430_g1_i1:150-1499(+)
MRRSSVVEGEAYPLDSERQASKKHVQFSYQYEEIPPPNYDAFPEDADLALRPLNQDLTRAFSSLKKRKFLCTDENNVDGYLTLKSHKLVFQAEDATEPHAVALLADISNTHSLTSRTDSDTFSLVFVLKDKTKRKFFNLELASNAFQSIVDDAETLGYVITLDMLLPFQDTNSELAVIHPVDIFEAATPGSQHKRKGTSIFTSIASRHNQRFVNDMFNLNLTYITKRLIVMAYPGSWMKGIKWNKWKEVRDFFEHRHPHNYMVYNLNMDLAFRYPPSQFDGRVRIMGILDHSPPGLIQLFEICHDIAAYLRQAPQNVVAVHCKSGTGRSGVVACAWLLYAGLVNTADQAVELFSMLRTPGRRGVEIPSQIRYIRYMEQSLTNGVPFHVAHLVCIEFSKCLGKRGIIVRITSNFTTAEIEVCCNPTCTHTNTTLQSVQQHKLIRIFLKSL